MNKHAVYHRIKGNYAFAVNETTVAIRLRTAANDVESVNLAYGYDWIEEEGVWNWNRRLLPMYIEHETAMFTYWRVEIAIDEIKYQLRYGFELTSGSEKYLYIERGFFFVDDQAVRNDINSFFAFPYLHNAEIVASPAWVNETIWYQIFPDRFCNGDTKNDPAGVHAWSDTILGAYENYGGDIAGIIEKLDYLKELGITGLYLTPIFVSPTSHKYDTTDYFEIDPHFGTKEEFKKLVEQAHERGIKIMLDAVYNHIGASSKQFQDVLEKGKDSVYYDWFYIEKESIVDTDGNLDKTAYRNFDQNMPKLNTQHPEVIQYLLDVSTYWIREFDIDAWRLDVANEVDHEFWRQFRKAVRSVKEDVYILGETWHDSYPWLLGDQFDATMNYPLTRPILEWVVSEHTDANFFQQTFVEAIVRYSDGVNKGMFNLLDSHDTPRLLTVAKGNVKRVEAAYALLYTAPGTPCIYYGSEMLLDGANDPDCRKPMPWDKTRPEMFGQLQKLIQLRKDYPELRGNDLDFIYTGDHDVVFTRGKENTLIVIVNMGEERTYDLSDIVEASLLVDLMDNEKVSTQVTVAKEEYRILKVMK